MTPDIQLLSGDSLLVLPTLEAGSFDAVVTDPPYGLEFMGKEWDKHKSGTQYQEWCEDWATQVLRVLKPGGYMLTLGGTRTYHRLACAVEDAGWEIRDCLMWLYGTGFPKAKSCLKPAYEPILLCRKPGPKVLPLNIDECRVPDQGASDRDSATPQGRATWKPRGGPRPNVDGETRIEGRRSPQVGRWPTNVILDGSDEVTDLFPVTKAGGSVTGHEPSPKTTNAYGEFGGRQEFEAYGDGGSAARFFTSSREGEPSADSENMGDVGFRMRPGMRRETADSPSRFFYVAKAARGERGEGNTHPTVKPVTLMEHLVQLICSEGGIVLDPFLGSGTTALACANTGRRCVGIEREVNYLAIAEKRLGGKSVVGEDSMSTFSDSGENQ